MASSALGSYRYMSPERIMNEKYDAAADVWSVGITIIELWKKEYPFCNVADTPVSLMGELQGFTLEKILPRNAGISNLMRDFLRSMLAYDPNDRPSCMELTHTNPRWFDANGTISYLDGCLSLNGSREIIIRWLKDVDKTLKWKSAQPSSFSTASTSLKNYPRTHQPTMVDMNTSSQPRVRSLPAKEAAAIVKDINEMSISIDQSHSKWDFNPELSMSRSHNPFVSSGNLSNSINTSGHSQSGHSHTGLPLPGRPHTVAGSNAVSSSHYSPPPNKGNDRRLNQPHHQQPHHHHVRRVPSDEDDKYASDQFEVEEDVEPYHDDNYDFKNQYHDSRYSNGSSNKVPRHEEKKSERQKK
jgi:hypothetical protein